jgi:hypothetical protein
VLRVFKPLMAGEGDMMGLNGGFKAGEGNWLTGITRHETGVARKARGGGNQWQHDWTRWRGWGEKELTGGAHTSVTGKRKGTTAKCTNLKRWCTPGNTPRACGLTGPVREVAACGEGRAGVGQTGPDPREDSNKKGFLNF